MNHGILHNSTLGTVMAICGLTLLIYVLYGGWPLVRFPRENIAIHVYPDHTVVSGMYEYVNPYPFPVAQGMAIPLPVDADHPEPYNLEATRLTPSNQPVPFAQILGLNRFTLRFKPREQIRLGIQYIQYAPQHDARYILTTTKPWRRPLEKGVYSLHAHNVVITSSSYRLEHRAENLYVFERERFMPTQDWCFAWKEVSP